MENHNAFGLLARLVILLVLMTVASCVVLTIMVRADECGTPDLPKVECPTRSTPTTRICASGYVVEIGPQGWMPDETRRYTEGRDTACHDVHVGETIDILEWTPENGHEGRAVRVTVNAIGNGDIDMLAPHSNGVYTLEILQGYGGGDGSNQDSDEGLGNSHDIPAVDGDTRNVELAGDDLGGGTRTNHRGTASWSAGRVLQRTRNSWVRRSRAT